MLKKLGILLLVLVLGASGVLYYIWSRATQLPEWYVKQPQAENPPPPGVESLGVGDAQPEENIATSADAQPAERTDPSTRQDADNADTQINPSPRPSGSHLKIQDGEIEITLSEQDVTGLVNSAIFAGVSDSEFAAVVKGTHTEIENGRIESGAVVDLRELPLEELSPEEQAAIAQVFQTFPILKDREVYIGIEGTPKVKNGRIQLDRNTKIKVGNLSMKLSQLSQQTGTPIATLEDKINRALDLEGIRINRLELTDESLLIRGSTN